MFQFKKKPSSGATASA